MRGDRRGGDRLHKTGVVSASRWSGDVREPPPKRCRKRKGREALSRANRRPKKRHYRGRKKGRSFAPPEYDKGTHRDEERKRKKKIRANRSPPHKKNEEKELAFSRGLGKKKKFA